MNPFTSSKSGFTIVELLVATAVTAVLVALMITMTSGVLTAWNRTSGALTANNQGKIVLDQVAQDLQAAVFRYDPENPTAAAFAVEILDRWGPAGGGHNSAALENQRWWVPPETGEIFKPVRGQVVRNLQDQTFNLKDPDLANCRYGVGGAWLRLFTNGTRGENTVPTAVSYQIVRRRVTGDPDPNATPPNPTNEIRYMFFRSEVGGHQLLRDGYDLADTTTVGHYSRDTGIGSLMNPGNSSIVGNNVIDFGVRLYVRRPPGDPPGLDPIFPIQDYQTQRFDFDDNHTQFFADGSGAQPFPDVADIMVRILTEEGARQIQHLEAGRTYQNVTNVDRRRELWWEIAEANSRVFTRRVFLNSRPY